MADTTIELTGEDWKGAGNDHYQAVANRQTRLAWEAAEARSAAPTTPDESWPVEPTAAEIRAEMALFGDTFEFCRDKLRKQLRSDASRLKSAAPGAVEIFSKEMAELEIRRAAAVEKLALQEGAIEGIVNQLVQLAKLRSRAEKIRAVSFSKSQEATIADAIFELFIQKSESPSPAIQSDLEYQMRLLLERKALSPFVDDFASRIEEQASALAASIRSDAKTNGLKLSAVALRACQGIPDSARLLADLIK